MSASESQGQPGGTPEGYVSPEERIRAGARAAGHPYASRDTVETMASRLEELEGRIAELELRGRTQDDDAAEMRDRG